MLTNFNDFTIALNESTFNTLIRAFRQQAPMIFNYATPDLITSIHNAAEENPNLLTNFLCDIEPVESNAKRKNPLPVAALFTPTPYLPIPGYDGKQGLSYIVQVTDLRFDFHPNNRIELPAQLTNRFNVQTIGLQLKLCAGLACPDKNKVEKIFDERPPPEPFDPATFGKKFQKFDVPKPGDFPTDPFDIDGVDCFCLNVFALARIRRRFKLIDPDKKLEYVSLELTAVEIVDISPEKLENSLECLIYMVLNFGLLPKLRMLVKDLVVARGPFSVRLTSLSDKIPFNPSVEKDELRAFLSITTS